MNGSMERILQSDWLRDSPYLSIRTGTWTGQLFNTINDMFYSILVQSCWYTLKVLLTESSVHVENICFDIQWSMNLTAFSSNALNFQAFLVTACLSF